MTYIEIKGVLLRENARDICIQANRCEYARECADNPRMRDGCAAYFGLTLNQLSLETEREPRRKR
ncbi:hypothetical protein COU62_02340 [Candidatus Pacearchaeota archaeon CG10_big_fil_rev_8_21_14_0_10_35_219]|nr:hypothetical protein [Candidatus Pacearchaeota archaeon]OIO41980.1 MAG: hypothetical protein AUJ63_04480 [Candidatus Pacearchaeota archaeon CG1_02_35_32]PIO07807.1 MAG: hypothetical protein COU62_02340 [Candidatus Pacearchaeota archaeon CG10_big_fil_rev_8_21_14_0_10_35_219]PIY81029.1 MAG: hypothetical protein COY79_04450 [Candidatus Pacearchaeota archaeon CG_4_10_14_0_8_um_filter_35_169]PIZ79898.1 MAG: hypothetical protein COY00_02755 [Candidatus Pacearchaeota archaeon CG_4_10_14_0_2_um_filt